MNMIEKVARALARRELTDLGRKTFDADLNYYNQGYSSNEKATYEAQAKIAIDAMREPTEEMIKVGGEEAHNYLGADESLGIDGTSEIYTTMIDAALKE